MSQQHLNLNLGTSSVNDFIYNSNNSSIRKYYNFNGDISFYNPNLDYFTSYFNSNIQFNNKFKLVRLYKRKNRIKTMGYVYKALIKHKNMTFFDDVFIKEMPVLSANLYPMLNMKLNNSISPLNCKYSNMLYSKSSAVNVEIFVSYLVSRLNEYDYSPTFLKYYGCHQINMNKFTYMVGDDSELQEMGLNENSCTIFFKPDEVYLEVYDMPTYLLSIEKADFDIDSIKRSINSNPTFLLSITFQLLTGIFTMYNLFGIKHNDLHLGNIMFNRTKRKNIYYNVDNTIYKVPTFGLEAKIIDWGRATYDFKGFKGKNSIFNIDGECFGQYIFNKIGNSKKPIELEYNKYSDIVMLSHNLLFDFEDHRNSKWGKYLKNIIINTEGELLNYTKFNWSIYKEIGTKKFNIRPRNIVKNKIFNTFICNKEETESTNIYNVVLDKQF